MVALKVGNDINLIENDARVEHVEGRIVKYTGECDILQELETVCVMNLLRYDRIVDGYRLVEVSRLTEEFAIVSLVSREFRVICRK